MAGVRLAASMGRMTANVASAIVYGAPPPAPVAMSPRGARQQYSPRVDLDDNEQATLLRSEPPSPAGASPYLLVIHFHCTSR